MGRNSREEEGGGEEAAGEVAPYEEDRNTPTVEAYAMSTGGTHLLL